jgi:acetyl-CoA synthetase
MGASEARASYDEFCRRSLDDPEGFWLEEAQILDWTRQPDRAFEQPDPPSFRWFPGGHTNISVNALDRHVAAGRGDTTALITLDERGGRRALTYRELLGEVERVAAALRGLGIGKGDRLTIYIPTTAEAIIAMLATARIGALHCVVFAGFGAGALGERIRASGSRIVLTSDITYRKGKDVDLLELVDEALNAEPNDVEHLIVLRRTATARPPRDGELSWDEFLAAGDGQSGAVEDTLATDPVFILATSGTTAKPKLAVHTHGGYAVHIAAMGKWVMGLRQGETWWSSSDIGWAVGHSYIVYAPLMAGATTIAYEGAIDYPDANTAWSIIERERVAGVFTSPTAIRLLMRYGEEIPRRHDLTSLERFFSAGEVLNAPAWEWLQKTVFEDRIPVIDHMWQTETGGPIFGNPYGIELLPIKPGSAGIALPGIEADIVDQDGLPQGVNHKGVMRILRPFPGLIATLWGEPQRYVDDYWRKIEGGYYVGDAAHIDEDGYVWFAGRADEIIKIADHRIGTIEVETAFLHHPAVAEAGVTGVPDELRGAVIEAFVALRAGHEPSEELRQELLQTVRRELGPIAVIKHVSFVAMLPKTRSGKIMRRVLKAVALDMDPGDISTIEDEGSVEEARRALEEFKAGIQT